MRPRNTVGQLGRCFWSRGTRGGSVLVFEAPSGYKVDVNPLETYLKELSEIRATGGGDPEISGYGPLERLLDEVGKMLKPRVRCVISLANRGGGKPDGGLFTAEQFRKGAADPWERQPPARGVVEVKGPADDVSSVAETRQVKGYLDEYGLVLVTNYRDFLLVGRDTQGRPLPLEGFTIAEGEPAFWRAAAHPEKTAKELGERFVEYLKRVMLTNAPLSAPQDLAWFLASYARDARARVEGQKDLSALGAVRDALEGVLGMRFAGEEGEHFFRSTLVQTVFYGVFSAWVLWHREDPDRTDPFDWRMAEWSLHVPFIRALYEQVATPSKLGDLGLVEVLNWTAAALNRVDRAAFFGRFQDEHAVQYFYEPFLEAFDPKLRKALGVWYTPPEIVQYQVARVDAVLRDELGLADGLADPNVVILDPCCGTGAYLVEALRRIADTLQRKGGDALMASDLKKAAMTRVFGFEILPAPFVISHLQLGLLLHRFGAPLTGKESERVGVYLTNALSGWEPPKEPKDLLLFPELAAERDAAEEVKRRSPVLVVLGNPPYNAFAGVSPEEEQGLVEPYKVGLNAPVDQGGWGIKKFNLDDLYVRFFRLAERRIAEMTGRGVVSFISNHSWISEPSFVVLRKHLLDSFDRFWVENLHGNRKISEYAPDGRTSETIFAIRGFSPGIQQGVATSLWVKTGRPRKEVKVLFRDDIDAAKADERRQQLLRTLDSQDFDTAYTQAKPCRENRYSFRPEDVSSEYSAWPTVAVLAQQEPFNGPIERRGQSLTPFRGEEDHLRSALTAYLDPQITDEEMALVEPRFMATSGEFDARSARCNLKGRLTFDPSRLVRYPFKPLDIRLAYLDPHLQPLFSRPSPELLSHAFAENHFLVVRETSVKNTKSPPMLFSQLVCDYHALTVEAKHIPFLLASSEREKAEEDSGLAATPGAQRMANLSVPARRYLASSGIKDPDATAEQAELIWMHALAIGYSPAYLTENADGIRRDWPRIPLPDGREALETSGQLGRRVAALLDTEADAPGVTAGAVEPALRTMGVLTKVGGGALDPDAGDLAVTVGWGHAGKGDVTMPGKGRLVERPYEKAELDAIVDAAKARDLSPGQVMALLGPSTRDVYLNDRAYWKNVPAGVWEYVIGGYQVIKKWLSYREKALLGRALKPEEAREVTNMARRLTAITLLQPALDENYRAVKGKTWPWPHAREAGTEA
jgi:hypothetical protein